MGRIEPHGLRDHDMSFQFGDDSKYAIDAQLLLRVEETRSSRV